MSTTRTINITHLNLKKKTLNKNSFGQSSFGYVLENKKNPVLFRHILLVTSELNHIRADQFMS